LTRKDPQQEAKMETDKSSFPVSGAFVIFLVVFALATSQVWAQTTVNANWTDSTGNWTTPSNWSCNCVPNNSSANVFNVTIPTGDVSLDDTSSLASATINTLSLGAPLEINDGESLNVTGNVDATHGSLAVDSFVYGPSAPLLGLSVGGNFTGSVTVGSSVSNIYGTLSVVSVVGAFTGNAFLYPFSTLQASSFTNTNYTRDYGGTITVSGDLTNENGQVIGILPNGPPNGNQGTLNVGGNLRNSGIVALQGYERDLGSTLNVSGNLINTSTGDIEIPSISTASVVGSTSNSGTMTLAGAGGLLNEFPAVMTSGDFSNAGTLNLESGDIPEFGSSLTVSSFGNTGMVDISPSYIRPGGALLTVSTGGDYTQTAGSTEVDGTLMAPSVIISGGTLSGSGTIHGNLVNGAIVSPLTVVPNSFPATYTPATLTVHGDYTQNADGALVIDIASAEDYSTLDISGTASLDGIVDFDFLNGYVPAANTDFTFLKADSITGAFSAFDFTNGSCPTCSFQVRTTPELGSLTLFGTGLLGLASLLLKKRTRACSWCRSPRRVAATSSAGLACVRSVVAQEFGHKCR
jgi:hypothetical protein